MTVKHSMMVMVHDNSKLLLSLSGFEVKKKTSVATEIGQGRLCLIWTGPVEFFLARREAAGRSMLKIFESYYLAIKLMGSICGMFDNWVNRC